MNKNTETTLPNHPDSTPRISDELSKEISVAYDNKNAIYLGRSEYQNTCSWEFYKYNGKIYCFLNDVGEWGWEVSEQCAENYIEVKAVAI